MFASHNENCRCHRHTFSALHTGIISTAVTASHVLVFVMFCVMFLHFMRCFTANWNPLFCSYSRTFGNNFHYLNVRVCAVTLAINFARVTSLASIFCIDFEIHLCHTSQKHDEKTDSSRVSLLAMRPLYASRPARRKCSWNCSSRCYSIKQHSIER